MRGTHEYRTYAEGTSASEDRPEPRMPADEVTCQLCMDFETLSPRKMRLHAAGWCPEAVPMEEAITLVDDWFDQDGDVDEPDVDEDQDDEDQDDEDEEQEDAMPEPEPPRDEPEKSQRQIVHALVEDHAEPGEAFETSDLYDSFEERTGLDGDRDKTVKRVSRNLTELREERKVEDAGYGTWRRPVEDAMCEGANELPHDVPDDVDEEDGDDSPGERVHMTTGWSGPGGSTASPRGGVAL